MTTRTSADSKLLLFVCTGNFYRSRHAEALFNWHAEHHGLAARAFSRGLLTSLVADEPTLLSRDTERRLGELGIPLHHTGEAPTQLRKEDLARAYRTIALKRELPEQLKPRAIPIGTGAVEAPRIAKKAKAA